MQISMAVDIAFTKVLLVDGLVLLGIFASDHKIAVG